MKHLNAIVAYHMIEKAKAILHGEAQAGSVQRVVRGERQQHKNMDKEKLQKITDEQLEKVAVLVYQYDFPKDRDLPHQELKYKALHRYHNYPLTQKVVRDLVSLNLQTLIQIETAMMPEVSNAKLRDAGESGVEQH